MDPVQSYSTQAQSKRKKLIIIAGIVLLFVLMMCSVGLFFYPIGPFRYFKEDTPSTTGNEAEPDGTKPESSVPDTAVQLQPYQTGAWYAGTHHHQVFNVKSPEECRQKALELGYNAYGHRSDTHPESKWKNSCFLMFDGFDPNQKHLDAESNPVHSVGCTFPGDTIEKGCRDPAYKAGGWYDHVPTKDHGWVPATNVNDCIEFAKENGYAAWGYRTNGKTCWMMKDGFDYNAFHPDPNPNAPIHISGCTNRDHKITSGCKS